MFLVILYRAAIELFSPESRRFFMRIVGLCNLKGGVGKTTACQNLAVALARRGLRVAALDLDPQSNLTAGFGISVPEEHPYIYDFLLGEASFEEVKITREGVDVVPKIGRAHV
jgi:chromosome partitioning protein